MRTGRSAVTVRDLCWLQHLFRLQGLQFLLRVYDLEFRGLEWAGMSKFPGLEGFRIIGHTGCRKRPQHALLHRTLCR